MVTTAMRRLRAGAWCVFDNVFMVRKYSSTDGNARLELAKAGVSRFFVRAGRFPIGKTRVADGTRAANPEETLPRSYMPPIPSRRTPRIRGVLPCGEPENAEAPLPQRLAFPCRGIANGKRPVRACVHAAGKLALPPTAHRSARSSSTRWELRLRAGQATPPRRSMPRRYLPCAPSARISHPGGRFPPYKQGAHSASRTLQVHQPSSSSMSLPYSSTLRTHRMRNPKSHPRHPPCRRCRRCRTQAGNRRSLARNCPNVWVVEGIVAERWDEPEYMPSSKRRRAPTEPTLHGSRGICWSSFISIVTCPRSL